MAARANSIDPRAERVRTRLREAAFALAHERPVDQMTVSDIVARASVSRQVFYQHFTDRDDAVATAFNVAFAAATADIGGDARARVLRLFDFAAEHRSMYRNIVPSAVTGLTPESVSRFLVGGFMEVLRSWMESPDPTDLSGRVGAALDTVNALLGLTTHSKGPQHG